MSSFFYAKLKGTATAEHGKIKKYSGKVKRFKAKLKGIGAKYNCIALGYYLDDGISGTNTKKREEFNRMIEDTMAGKIDMIITKSISRFARNTLDCLKYIRQLKEKNVPVFFEKENINTMDSKGDKIVPGLIQKKDLKSA